VRETQSRIASVEAQMRQRAAQAETAVTIAERRVAEAYDSGDGRPSPGQPADDRAIATRESVKADVREFERVKKDLDRVQPLNRPSAAPSGG